MNTERATVIALTLLLASACGGDSDDTGSARNPDLSPEQTADAGSQGEADDDDAPPDDPGPTDAGGPPIEPDLDCTSPQPGRAPLRRLSNYEYVLTIRDLLGPDLFSTKLAPTSGKYGNDADWQSLSPFSVEQYLRAAKQIAQNTLLDPTLRQEHFACIDAATPETEAECTQSIIEDFGRLAFRRPLDAETQSELLELQAQLRANGTYEESIRSLLEAMLQGPDFLYRLEFGDPNSPADARRPSAHEMATRLSYLFSSTMPDAELRAAAEAGELDSDEGVAAQASRLIAAPGLRNSTWQFFDGFLELDSVSQYVLPNTPPNLFGLFVDETRGFLEQELFSGSGSWQSVFTAPYVFVNEELAGHYGIDGVVGEEFRAVEVDPEATHRRGLLTQGSTMVRGSAGEYTHPFRRGLYVARNLMCFELPLAPADVPFLPPVDSNEPKTTRERFEQSTLATPECASCHMHADPIGFALENYDFLGRWRDQENGLTIDAQASTPTLGEFSGPEELIQKVAAHPDTYSCFAKNWAQFAYGRELDDTTDQCTLAQLEQEFEASGYQLTALLQALTQTDAFLYLPEPEATQ